MYTWYRGIYNHSVNKSGYVLLNPVCGVLTQRWSWQLAFSRKSQISIALQWEFVESRSKIFINFVPKHSFFCRSTLELGVFTLGISLGATLVWAIFYCLPRNYRRHSGNYSGNYSESIQKNPNKINNKSCCKGIFLLINGQAVADKMSLLFVSSENSAWQQWT